MEFFKGDGVIQDDRDVDVRQHDHVETQATSIEPHGFAQMKIGEKLHVEQIQHPSCETEKQCDGQ